jgi:hypothetical protein
VLLVTRSRRACYAPKAASRKRLDRHPARIPPSDSRPGCRLHVARCRPLIRPPSLGGQLSLACESMSRRIQSAGHRHIHQYPSGLSNLVKSRGPVIRRLARPGSLPPACRFTNRPPRGRASRVRGVDPSPPLELPPVVRGAAPKGNIGREMHDLARSPRDYNHHFPLRGNTSWGRGLLKDDSLHLVRFAPSGYCLISTHVQLPDSRSPA